MGKLAVIAIGGNSLIRNKHHQSVEDQHQAICETVANIVDIVEQGYRVVVTHGNGPQVGFILRRSEIAYKVAGMHQVPLVNCGANTQGSIGYQIQQAFNNEFQLRGMNGKAVAVVTQVEVDKKDPAFANPIKPIGSFYTEAEVQRLQEEYPHWELINDAGRGYRRLVPSPAPRKIIELEAIQQLAEAGFCVIAVGGGGIPVFRNEQGLLEGIDAVIDKDFASGLLAANLHADLFIVSTAVEQVYLNFGKPDQQPLHRLSCAEAEAFMEQGHFPAGSMLPKIQAVIEFLKNGGRHGIITGPAALREAVREERGTHITG